MNEAVAAAVVNTLSSSRLGGGRVFIMAVGDGVPIGVVEMRVVSGDLSEVGVSRASQRVRKDEMKEDACGVSEAFRLPAPRRGRGTPVKVRF